MFDEFIKVTAKNNPWKNKSTPQSNTPPPRVHYFGEQIKPSPVREKTEEMPNQYEGGKQHRGTVFLRTKLSAKFI